MTMHALPVAMRSTLRGLRAALLLGATLALVACGGDSACGDQPFGGTGAGSCGSSSGGGGGGGGGDGGTTATASDLSLVLSAPTVPNDGRSTVTATATAVDANRNAVAGIPVTFSVNNSAVATVSGAQTDKLGVVTAAIGTGADRANRTITVTATSGGLVRTATLQVTGANLTSTPLPAVINPSAPGKVDFRLLDVNSNPMVGQAIVVTGADGVETSAVTGNNGDYSYAYTAPATGGTISIRASAGGVTTTQSVVVQSGSGTIPPATVAVQSASLAASPSVVPVNSGETDNRSELRALFLGAGNTPVKNVRVRFDLAGDANNIGGAITSGDNVVYSDANGVATSAYVAGSRFSPTDGLTVRACWSENDFAAGTCPKQATATLTVISQPLSVTIGTNALIEEGPTKLDYIKKYLVQVNDSSGNAKAGVLISPSVDLVQYLKGYWVPNVLAKKWEQVVNAQCDNEDLNRNGVLQVYPKDAFKDPKPLTDQAEDANGNGSLDPRKADVAISFVGSNTTNSDGQVVLKITYPQNVGSWLRFNILVAASGIAGTEGRTNYTGVLPIPAEAVNAIDKQPAFVDSPYGLQPSATVLTTTPEGQSGLLCTNPN